MAITPILPITSITSITSMQSITPLKSIEPDIKLKSLFPANEAQPQEVKKSTFADMLTGMVKDISATGAQTKADAVNMALGLTDLQDLHNVEINAVRADLAIRTMTTVRNKVLDAYTEIMRITI